MCNLFKYLNLMFCSFTQNFSFGLHFLLIWTCFLQLAFARTYAHVCIEVVSSMWCVKHLITKTGRNGPMPHFPFNISWYMFYGRYSASL
jgi:O-antigen ligase